MAEQVGEIYYTVDARTDGLVTSSRAAEKQLDGLQESMGKTDKAAARTQKAANDAAGGIGKVGKEAQTAGTKMDGFATKLSPLAVAIGGLVTIDTLRRIQQLGEEFTLLQARVTRLSGSTQQAATNYQTLLNIASTTGATMGDTVKLWESLTATLRELGGTDAQVLRLTETLQKIGTIGGSSTQELSDGLRQLGQALAGGVIRAEEFNSIVENVPQLAREIAAGLGIPFGELRQLMLDGELTAEKVLGAIQTRTQDVDREFAKLPRTVGQAANALTNEFGAALSTLDKAVGFSEKLAFLFDKIASGVALTAGNLTDQQRLNQLVAERVDLEARLQAMRENDGKNLRGIQSLTRQIGEANLEILQIQNRVVQGQKDAAKPIAGGGTKADPEANKALETLREQAAAAKLSGEERAKLIAVQKLGDKATKEEIAEAERLASAIYAADAARKTSVATRKEENKEERDAAKARQENEQAVTDLAVQLSLAALKGRELAEAQATLKLNEFATPDQIARVKQLAAAIEAQKQAEANQQLLGQVDPIAGEQQRFTTELENLRKLNEAKLLEDQRYRDLKTQAEVAHAEQMKVLQEENFRKQSELNNLLLASLDQLQQGATNALTGLITGASNGEDAIRSLASSILNEAVGAVVKLGIEQVKALVMGQAAQTAAAGTAAATGAAMTASYAPAAAAASIASFGGAAGAGLAALASAIPAALGLFGGRQYGGGVNAGGLYRINENGAPEVFQDNAGKQYMLPNTRGEVISNRDAQGGGGGVQVSVNLIEDSSKGGQVSQRQEGNKVQIDAFVADIRGGGPASRAIEQTYGVRRVGQ